MKIHKMEVYVYDFEGYGAESYKTELEGIDSGNAIVRVKETKTIDFDSEEFEDSPFNHTKTPIEELRKYFK